MLWNHQHGPLSRHTGSTLINAFLLYEGSVVMLINLCGCECYPKFVALEWFEMMMFEIAVMKIFLEQALDKGSNGQCYVSAF